MDNLTHSLIGAGIAGALLTRRLGPRAMLIGVVAANLPDLDIFIHHGNAINAMTYHRGFSHSLLFETAAAPLIAWGMTKVWTRARVHWWMLLLTVWLCLVTHALLDSLTTYGTQLFWPIHALPPVAVSSIFIIDPLFTLMLLVGIVIAVSHRKRPGQGGGACIATLCVAGLYLGAGMAGHVMVKARAAADPAFAGEPIFVQPAPLNILFWTVMAVSDNQVIRGESLAFPGCPISNVEFEPRYARPPEGFEITPAVRRLEWFTNGFYMYRAGADGITISDLRIGIGRALPFTFQIGEAKDGAYVPVPPRQVGGGINPDGALSALFHDIGKNWRKCAGRDGPNS
jgi:inner membrane protein